MAYTLHFQKVERTKLRRLPFLPRFGITIDTFGRQLTIKQVPLLETLLNLRDRGFNLGNFRRLAKEEWDEIRFPTKGSASEGRAAVKAGRGRTKKASTNSHAK